MRALSVLLLSDDRPGHYHLAEGVIAAITRVRPATTAKLPVQRRKWLPGRVLGELFLRGASPRTLLTLGYGLDERTFPKADLIVSAGGETLIPNAAIARLIGAPNIFCGSLRRLPVEAFSLVVSSYARHAALPRHIVALKPNGIDPDTLGRSVPTRKLGPASPPRLAGLLIGGDSGFFRYERAEWQALFAFVRKTHLTHGTRWAVSTSRRSPAEIGDELAAIAAEPDSPITELIDFRTAGPGTLSRIFGHAEAILCTEDSSTMLSEAVCARLPVVGVSPARYGFKDEEREYREFMRAQGWCRFVPLAELTPERFVEEVGRIEPLAENHLDRLAAGLRKRLPQLFA
jgi:mitochondrial fission protein ELM1